MVVDIFERWTTEASSANGGSNIIFIMLNVLFVSFLCCYGWTTRVLHKIEPIRHSQFYAFAFASVSSSLYLLHYTKILYLLFVFVDFVFVVISKFALFRTISLSGTRNKNLFMLFAFSTHLSIMRSDSNL